MTQIYISNARGKAHLLVWLRICRNLWLPVVACGADGGAAPYEDHDDLRRPTIVGFDVDRYLPLAALPHPISATVAAQKPENPADEAQRSLRRPTEALQQGKESSVLVSFGQLRKVMHASRRLPLWADYLWGT